jgi:uncharacterized lipoprotein YajG
MIDMKIVILAAAAFVAATCSAPAQTSVVAAEANEWAENATTAYNEEFIIAWPTRGSVVAEANCVTNEVGKLVCVESGDD